MKNQTIYRRSTPDLAYKSVRDLSEEEIVAPPRQTCVLFFTPEGRKKNSLMRKKMIKLENSISLLEKSLRQEPKASTHIPCNTNSHLAKVSCPEASRFLLRSLETRDHREIIIRTRYIPLFNHVHITCKIRSVPKINIPTATASSPTTQPYVFLINARFLILPISRKQPAHGATIVFRVLRSSAYSFPINISQTNAGN